MGKTVRVYFRDGNSFEWAVGWNPCADWFDMIGDWARCVTEDSYNWATALMLRQDEWESNYYKGITFPTHPIGTMPDFSGDITRLEVDAVYVLSESETTEDTSEDTSEDTIIMYYIHPDADPKCIQSDHWNNRGKIIDLRDPLANMIREYGEVVDPLNY